MDFVHLYLKNVLKYCFCCTHLFRTILDRHSHTEVRLSPRHDAAFITCPVEMMHLVHLYPQHGVKNGVFFCTFGFTSLLDKHPRTGVRLSYRNAGSSITSFVKMMHFVHLYLQHGLENGLVSCTFGFTSLVNKRPHTGVRLSYRDAGSSITSFVEMMHLVHL